MSNCTSLSALNDSELLTRVVELRRREHETTLEILLHLNEIERRKLHLKLGYSSMFAYCTEHLRYSESAAGRRVQVARCVARFPEVATLLKHGDVNLSTLGLIASLLNEQTADPLLEQIRGKSQREVEEIASTFRPSIRLRDRVQRVNVRALAAPVAASPTLPREAAAPNPVLSPGPNSRCGSEPPLVVIETVSKLYIQFLADDAFMRDYNETCALLSHRVPRSSFAGVFGVLLKDFIARHSPRERSKRRERGRRDLQAPSTSVRGAGKHRSTISARTRDAVFVRDKGRCTYVGANGRRCGETRHLHIDHITPVARNGTNDPSNLRLLCARHNQLEAERTLGKELMSQHLGKRART